MKIGAIILIAIFMAALNGFLYGHISKITLPLTDVGFENKEFNIQSLSLLHTGTFNNAKEGFLGISLRGPGYVAALAGAFFLFGERIGSVNLLNAFFFALSIWLLWRVSRHVLPGKWALLPSLLTALYPGFYTHVWHHNYELYVLFFALVSFKAFFRYQETRSPLWLVLGASALALWIFEKPIVLYAIPFALFFLLASKISPVRKKYAFIHAFVFFAVLATIIGPWMLRNRIVLGTTQLATGAGSSMLRRSTLVDYPPSHIAAVALSFSVGDVIASKIHPSYPPDGKPAYWDPAVELRWYQSGWYIKEFNGEIITRLKLDQKMQREALANILRKPVKFILIAPLGLLRLNMFVNNGGMETQHLFWGTSLLGSEYVTITVILAIRLAWFAFLGVVLWMLIRHIPLWRAHWGLLLFFVIYFNLMYGLLTHAEARYIFTMMPLYFILFAEWVRRLVFWRAQKGSIPPDSEILSQGDNFLL